MSGLIKKLQIMFRNSKSKNATRTNNTSKKLVTSTYSIVYDRLTNQAKQQPVEMLSPEEIE